MIFKPKSVLNTDSFDRRTYTQLRSNAPKLTTLESDGKQKMPTFDHLMGDIWAGLYKNEPRLLDEEEVPEKVKPNRPIMENVMNNQNFTELREHCKLDELASALGLLHMGEKMGEFLDDLDQDTKEKMQDLQHQQEKAQQYRDKAEMLEEALENAGEDKKVQLKKQAANAKRNATRAENKADQISNQVTQAIANQLSSQKDGVAQVLQETKKGVKEDKEAISTFMSGLGYGTQPGEKISVDPASAIEMAESIKKSQKLKNISKLAGRMKKIAQKKQKSKTQSSTEKSDVTLGNEITQLLPQETVCLTVGEGTRKDFLKRYTEEKLLQYSPDAKEKLGKGPIVVCIDTSGSMRNLDVESKAVMIALLGIAKKQKRAFGVINFAYSSQITVWEYPKPQKLKFKDIVTMAEWFHNGGTNFTAPLNRAEEIISKSKYKKADVIFITDGDAMVSSQWLESFLRRKRELKFNIISVQLGEKNLATLKKFSDQVIEANSLFDSNVTDSVLTI